VNPLAEGFIDSEFTSLRAEKVVREFGPRRRRHRALDGIDLELVPGSSLGIVGESGSGKSTLSRLLVGLDEPTDGAVLLDGRKVRDWLATPASRVQFRRTVQYIAQDTTSSFDPHRTLRDSVRTPLRTLHGMSGSAADDVVDETVAAMGLDVALADRMPHQVSGGQRQRFAIARSFAVRPRVVLCDEIVSALDVSVQGSILNLVKDYCRSTSAALVFVSHGLPATAFVADDLVVMKDGRIVESGTAADVVERPQHEYTRSLLAAYAFTRKRVEPLEGVSS